MEDTQSRLLSLFELDRLGPDTFDAPNPGDMSFGRVFGGQVVAQALRASMLTVETGQAAHSLHAYFIRGGRPGVPIRIEVDRVRDGRSFSTRHAVASQEGEVIFSMSSSFHKQEEGDEWQIPMAAEVPDPDEMQRLWMQRMAASMPDGQEQLARRRRRGGFGRGVEQIELGATQPDARGVYASTKRSWIRADEEVGNDPALHQCVIAFMSDMGAAMGARVPHLMMSSGRGMGGASLDHSIWFHRPGRADEWMLFDLHAVSNYGARGFTRGTMHSKDGTLIASIVQEALLRPAGRVPG